MFTPLSSEAHRGLLLSGLFLIAVGDVGRAPHVGHIPFAGVL